MTKLVYIDVGTHFGQEFHSMFGSSLYFFWKLVRRIIGFYILRKGQKISAKHTRANSRTKKNKKMKKFFNLFY